MSETHILLQSQKNKVYKILQAVGLEPANFTWTEHNLMPSVDKIFPRLNYLDGNYYFQFEFYYGEHCCKFSPGEEMVMQSEKPKTWILLVKYFCQWLNCLKREIEAPDFWKEIEKYQIAFPLTIPEELPNEAIPAYEADQMDDRLSLLADQIEAKFNLQEEDNRFVRQKLNYLADAARRQPRRDWEYLVIGVLINIAFQLRVTPEQAKNIFQLAKECIGNLIHLISS